MKEVFDIKKYKTNQEIADVASHNLRQAHSDDVSKKSSRNVDKKRTPLNRYFVGSPDMDVIGELNKKLSKCEKYRKDANRTVNLVLSGSPDFFTDKKKTKDWEEASQRWLEDKFGKDNILYSVVHYDEKTPHFHVCIVPIHEGKLRSNYWFDGPMKVKRLLDDYHKAVKHLGLKRGDPYVKPTQKEQENYYKKVNSSTAYERQLDKRLDDLFEKLDNPTFKQRLNPYSLINDVVKPLMSQLAKNLSHYRTRAKSNEDEKKKAKDENKELKTRVQDLECKLESLGLNPNVSHLELSKISPKIRNLVEEAPSRSPLPNREVENVYEIHNQQSRKKLKI